MIDGHPAHEALLEPTRIYVRPVLALLERVAIKGLTHVTGGGISENLPRALPDAVHAEIDLASWRQDPVFDWLASEGNITAEEMRRTFNCGVGMIVAVDAADVDTALAVLEEHGENAWLIGRIAAEPGPVRFV